MTKIRQYFYLIAGFVAGIVPILTLFKLIDSEQAITIAALFDNVGSLIGAAAAGTAGVILSKQRKDGTVDAPPVSSFDRAIEAIPAVVKEAADAKANLDRLREVATEAIRGIPVYGDEAKAIIEALPRF